MEKFLRVFLSVAMFFLVFAGAGYACDELCQFTQQIATYTTATDNVIIEVPQDLTLTSRVTIPQLSTTAAGRTITIRSANRDQPVTLHRGVTGNLFTVSNRATLILENIIIDGGGNSDFSDGGGGPLIEVANNGTLLMRNGAVLRNNRGTAEAGGVLISPDGTFIMQGGVISGNSAGSNSGGVYVRRSTFNMTGGEISGNTAGEAGGVRVHAGTFSMSDGKISGNTANTHGGGVQVSLDATFTMTGGEISGNLAGNDGGGVRVIGATFAMSEGKISGNTANANGGGVQVSSSGTFTLTGGEIICNFAKTGNEVRVLSNAAFNLYGGTVSGIGARISGEYNLNNGAQPAPNDARIVFNNSCVYAIHETLPENMSVAYHDVDYTPVNSVDNGSDYLRPRAPSDVLMTYVSEDGTVSVCSATDTTTYIYEYSSDLRYIRTVSFQNELPTLGAFTKDNEGNFYFFYTKYVDEDEKDVENMAVVKYDSFGARLNMYRLKAFADNSFLGVRGFSPSGSRRMEISSNMLAIYFARHMFKASDGLTHQASYGFVLDKNTLARIDRGAATSGSGASTMSIPYVSHSFNQFILPVQDGFVFADKGDAGTTRTFTFAKFQNSQRTKRVNAPFRFKEGAQHYNFTFAQLGGLAETSNGYIFAGTYEKNDIASCPHNDSRNLLILTMDRELNTVSQPVWITDYTVKEENNAANPKIVELDNGRYLLMWEFMTDRAFKASYMLIIDEYGTPLTAVEEMPNVRLNTNDVLRYSEETGNVYWAVNTAIDGRIAVYYLKVGIPGSRLSSTSIQPKFRVHDSRYGIIITPNPANDVARISVITPEPAQINLRVLDNLGNTVFASTGAFSAGGNVEPIVWNLTNTAGRFVANGTYLVIVQARGISGRVYNYQSKIGVR